MTSMFLLEIVDLTDKTPKELRLRKRLPVEIESAILHQTAFSRGNVPESYKTVQAHYVVMPDGRAVHLHPVESYIVSSSAFNNNGIAIEFVGNFADDKGNHWKGDTYGKHKLTGAQIAGGRELLSHLMGNYGIEWVHAHRQGELANLRGNCPGPDIWYEIGEWAIVHLGLSDGGSGYVEGNGSPIPDSWRQPRK